MDWLQLTVGTTSELADRVSDILISAGSAGTVIEDKAEVAALRDSKGTGGWDIIDDCIVDAMPDVTRVTGYYMSDMAERAMETVKMELKSLAGAENASVEAETIAGENWAEDWKEQFQPIRLGESFIIAPSWAQCEPKPGDRIIRIDPGLAFGTGSHETTGMCVELVERYVKPASSVIDIGTGSAILAIAASMMGAKDVLAVDIDPLAVKTAQENVAENHAKNVRVMKGDLLSGIDERADVVIANIIAEVVISIAGPVKKHILPGGYFVCSGIPFEKSDDVMEELNDKGYIVQEVKHVGEWVAICAKKSIHE